jgi:protein dithiol oxidoreductase (disulfide-forming)
MWTKLSTVWSSLIAVAALCCATAVFGIDLQEGVNYKRLPTPQPVESGNKIEVIEFFSFACPHCSHFEPVLESWVKKLPNDVQFRRVPALFQSGWVELAKVYYTLDTLGQGEKLADSVFHAIHEEKLQLMQDTVFFDWAAKKGLDRQKVADIYSSFTVSSKVQRARSQAQAYRLEGVPAMAIDGKYFIEGTLAGSYESWVQIADGLIAKARQERLAKSK